MTTRLKHERDAKRLTQVDVSKLLRITDRAYRKIESGRCKPRYETSLQLEKVFGLSVQELLEDYTPETVTEGSK